MDVVGWDTAGRRRAEAGRESPQSRYVSISNHKKQNMTTTSPTRRRCVFVVSLLLLTSFPRYSCGQETATIADEAASAAAAAAAGDAVATESVIDLDDATESVIDLDDAGGGTAAAGDDGTACVVADDDDVGGGETTPDGDAAAATTTTTTTEVADDDGPGTAQESQQAGSSPVVQSGPFVDLLGDLLLSLEMIDETKAQVHQHPTNVALDGKKVVGLYFSADW